MKKCAEEDPQSTKPLKPRNSGSRTLQLSDTFYFTTPATSLRCIGLILDGNTNSQLLGDQVSTEMAE
ncbi:hypothetical protein G9A89_020789 [Geosiphon pyriformis]|nr:hypothetical protein G9A89_020789 [Geosiphon pyriformis]